jgi:hypothetical protein
MQIRGSNVLEADILAPPWVLPGGSGIIQANSSFLFPFTFILFPLTNCETPLLIGHRLII